MVLLGVALGSTASAAPVIPNPSFEKDTFSVSQGYISQNTPITGWVASDDGLIGQNPAGGDNIFADNGKVPHGTRVAFIQSTGLTSTLSTTITGLTVGKLYRVSFRANARNGDPPEPSYRINGGAEVDFNVSPVGGANPYIRVQDFFVATAATAGLEIINNSGLDSTLLVDDFQIFESATIQVQNINNDGPGSLRQALAAAKASAVPNEITFAPALNGQTIELLSEMVVDDTGGLVIDASALVKGLTLDGLNATRLLNLQPGAWVRLSGLGFTRGNGNDGSGGAIANQGTLAMTRCSLWGNIGLDGGALHNTGNGSMELTQCTLSGNANTSDEGGAICNASGTMTLIHCTVSGNTSTTFGGGVTNNSKMRVGNSIISGNTAPGGGADVDNYLYPGGVVAFVFREGANVIQFLTSDNGATENGPDAIVQAPALDALADNGGPTRTMALQASSPARNAAVGSTITSDQRGMPIQGTAADIGAYEMQRGTFVVTFLGLPGVSVNEANGVATATVKRLDGLEGTVTVDAATLDITATAGSDYTARTATLTFIDGVDERDFTVSYFNDSEVEPNETFAVVISNPSAGTSLGSRTRAHITMIDPSNSNSMVDSEDPGTPVITSPAANAVLNVDVGGTVQVQGSASDNSGIQGTQVRMLTAGALPSVLTFTDDEIAAATQSDWSIPVTPVAGLNTLEVQVRDGVGRVTTLTRSFKVRRPLKVQLGGNGTVTSGFAPVSYRDVGTFTTITATPEKGQLFTGWTANGAAAFQTGLTPAMLLQPKLSFTFREGLVLRANFVPHPFTPAVTGIYNGGITPNATLPTLSALDTEGYASFTVKSTGAFTGTLKIDGAAVPVSGLFDGNGVARFGPAKSSTLTVLRKDKAALTVTLNLDVTAPLSGNITGTINFLDGSGRQADIVAARTAYSAANPVDVALLGTNSADQIYTTGFFAKANAGYTADQFPQGTGPGSWKLTKTGNISLSATLADGTAFTASTTLSVGNGWRLYAPLYKGKGVIAGSVAPIGSATVDFVALNTFWVRPVQDTQHYAAGWPTGILVDMGGAKYVVSPGTSVVPGLTVGGLATVFLDRGNLGSNQLLDVTITSADTVTNLNNNPAYKLVIDRKTGFYSGFFTHDDGSKPAFKGVIINKAATSFCKGFFLSTAPKVKDYTGQGGTVDLQR